MRRKIWMLALLPIFFCPVYADENNDVQQGAATYDWETCFNDKSSNCINGCITSDETNCKENCARMASDKCQSEGLIPSGDEP